MTAQITGPEQTLGPKPRAAQRPPAPGGPARAYTVMVPDAGGGWREATELDLHLLAVSALWNAAGLACPPETLERAKADYLARTA